MNIQCPNCQSYKTKIRPPKTPLGIIGTAVMGFGLFLLVVSLFFWPLLPFAFAIILVGACVTWAAQHMVGTQEYRCQNCKHDWKI